MDMDVKAGHTVRYVDNPTLLDVYDAAGIAHANITIGTAMPVGIVLRGDNVNADFYYCNNAKIGGDVIEHGVGVYSPHFIVE